MDDALLKTLAQIIDAAAPLLIAAQGEFQASETLADAARVLSSQPAAIQLRYLQTVTEIAAENNSTTIFPIPIELFRPFLTAMENRAAGNLPAPEPAQPVTPTAAPALPSPSPILPRIDITQPVRRQE